MIKLTNGHELTFACGSGALGFDGRGWWWERPLRWLGLLDPNAFTVVAKTVTPSPKKGNLSMCHPWTCVRTLNFDGKRGATNAVGLTNPGIWYWIARDYPVAKKMGYKIAASIKVDNGVDAGNMQRLLEPLDLAYIEVNVSCPNLSTNNPNSPVREMAATLECLARGRHPLVLKMSVDQVHQEFVTATESYVQAYHAINTVPWDQIFKDRPSPIQKYAHGLKGGVSGDWIKEISLASLRSMKSMTDRPIISGGGIASIDDVYDRQDAGAEAFSIGTLFLIDPTKPNRIVKQFGKRNHRHFPDGVVWTAIPGMPRGGSNLR